MESRTLIRAVNYLFIYLVINYSLLTRFIIGFDTVGYGIIALSVVVVLLNLNAFGRIQSTKPIHTWLIWCFYAFFNYYLHPHDFSQLSVFELYKMVFMPLIVMTVVVNECRYNFVEVLWVCLITHMAYMFFGYYFDSGILFRIDERTNVLGNVYAIISCLNLFYLVLLNRIKRIRMIWFILFSVICVIVLAMSGTRKAFGAGLIIFVFWVLSFFELKKIKTWLIVVAIFVVGFWGYDQLMEKTFIGARIEMLEEQGETYLPEGAPEFLSVFGDRASHYYYGWKLFLENPILGVGTKQGHVLQGLNYQSYTHTEYIAQLVDGGIVAFILFSVFYYWIIKMVFKRHHGDHIWGRCMLGSLIALLFIYVTAWAWEFPHYFICLGILISYCNTDKKQVYQFLKK